MLEQIYTTLQGLIYVNMPQNANGNVVIYDREIKGWNLGDRNLKPFSPVITIQGEQSSNKEISNSAYEVEYNLNIKAETGNDNQSISETMIQEMVRLIYEALLTHRQIWVLVKCPICMSNILSPIHFTSVHPEIFQSFAQQAINNATTVWNETHSIPMPTLKQSRIATVAFGLVYEAIINNQPVPNLTSVMYNAFQAIINNNMRPIRLLYDVHLDSIRPSNGAEAKEFFHKGELTLIAKELIQVPAVGPDNVPTTGWIIQ